MSEEGKKIIDVLQEAYLKAKERFSQSSGVNPDEKELSPTKCVVGWGMLFLILNLPECPLKFNVTRHHKIFQAKLEVSCDCPEYGAYFIYE
jgi:hypothetical protein